MVFAGGNRQARISGHFFFIDPVSRKAREKRFPRRRQRSILPSFSLDLVPKIRRSTTRFSV
jgi:hypothetical protein